jgi:hypothetical protein
MAVGPKLINPILINCADSTTSDIRLALEKHFVRALMLGREERDGKPKQVLAPSACLPAGRLGMTVSVASTFKPEEPVGRPAVPAKTLERRAGSEDGAVALARF